MKKAILYILMAFMVIGCKTAEQRAEKRNPAPHWVESIPTNSDYYIGVFSTQKTNSNFREIAKKGALENLASEISVVISGESVLKTLETSGSFNQEYKQEVVVKSTENIEGYELVGTWENENEYWVYYKLSKFKYEEIKRARIRKAVNLGKDYFSRAKENHDKNNYHEAFVLSIKALESVSEYLDEPLKTEMNGKDVYFATEVMSYTQEMVNEIKISPAKKEYSILLGSTIGEDDVYFNVQNNKNQPISEVPLKCEYKAVFFKNYHIKSDESGIAGVSIGKINQSKEEQFISASLDFEELALEQTKNKIVLKLLNYIPAKTAKIKLKVRAPRIYVNSKEREFGKIISPVITPSVKQVLSSRGFTVVNSKRDADLEMLVSSNTKLIGQNGRTYQVEISGNVETRDVKTNEVVFSEVIQSAKGLQLNKAKASLDAYSKAESYVKRRVIPKLANSYFAF